MTFQISSPTVAASLGQLLFIGIQSTDSLGEPRLRERLNLAAACARIREGLGCGILDTVRT
jgi:hypothetical protein